MQVRWRMWFPSGDEGARYQPGPGFSYTPLSPPRSGARPDPGTHAVRTHAQGQSLPWRHIASQRGDAGSGRGRPAGFSWAREFIILFVVHPNVLLQRWWRSWWIGSFHFHECSGARAVAVANYNPRCHFVLLVGLRDGMHGAAATRRDIK